MQYVKVYLRIFCGNRRNHLAFISSSGCYYAHLCKWKWADQYLQNPVSILAKVGRWNDPRDLSSRSSFPGSALYFPTPFLWSSSSITLEWQWDGRQIKDFFFLSSGSVIPPGWLRKKPFSLCWTVMKVSPAFELELNMRRRIQNGRLPCSVVSCAPLRSLPGVLPQCRSVPPGPPLGLTFILGHFLVATPPPVGQTCCDGSNP